MGRRKRQQSKRLSPQDFSKVVKAHTTRLDNIANSRKLSPEGKRAEAREAKRAMSEDVRKTRMEVLEDMELQAEEAGRRSWPSPTPEVASEMQQIITVHGERWKRDPASILRAAERYEADGNESGVRACLEFSDLLPQNQRSQFVQNARAVVREDFHPEALEAEKEQARLERDRDQFQVASALRSRTIIAARTRDVPEPNPMSGSQSQPAPQR